jgi:asparagine synthase (glutamine-hydrolysing)
MSAVCGIVQFNDDAVTTESMEPIMKALAHRGPDGAAIWTEGPCGLGHQMFHITPESLTEKLPYHDHEAGLVISADSRLDNRQELMDVLDIPLSERGIPDSLLILQAYKKWEEDCPGHLLGAFACTIWDTKQRKLVLLTDHMGRTPLFYHQNDRAFLFASEIKGLLAHPDVSVRLNMEKIAAFGVMGLILRDKSNTFFSGIYKMPAACIMTVKDGEVSQHTYWTPEIPPSQRFKTEDEFVETFQEVFSEAIRARTRSIFPVASLYSGGLDSSAVTAMAARVLKDQNTRLAAFAAVLPEKYKGTGTDEREYVDVLKGADNIDLHYISDEERGPFDDLGRLIWSGDSPSYTSRHYQMTAFARQAMAQGCRVILDGVGGEFGPSFHGDGIMAEWFLRGHWFTLLKELQARSSVEDRSIWGLIKGEVIKPMAPSFVIERRPRFDFEQLFQGNPIRESFMKQYLQEDLLKGLCGVNQEVWPRPDHRGNQCRPLGLIMDTGGSNGYVGYENVRSEHPFLDLRVLEFCLSAPSELKIRNGYKRNLIRLGMKGILPDKLRFRTSKEPFGPDFHDRYNRQRPGIVEMLTQIKPGDPVREIVDVEKLLNLAQYDMQTNRCNTPMEFAAMHSVPRGIYLITFLRQFEKYWV